MVGAYDSALFPRKPYHGRFRDIEGQRFGRLLVVAYGGSRGDAHSQWVCLCGCGKWRVVVVGDLLGSKTKSCGCYRSEATGLARLKHGHYRTGSETGKIRSVWKLMLSRCFNEKDPSHFRYGARGITVCDRWRDSFEAFLEDMGPRPKGYTLERIDNNGNYEPENCKWAKRLAQANNMRSNKRITFNGKTMNLRQWARDIGISHETLSGRINRHRWPIERALTEPVNESQRREVRHRPSIS